MRRLAFVVLALVVPSAADAQDTIAVQAADGFRFIRCVAVFGSASCGFVATGEGPLRCVAFDADDEPIAATTTFAEMSAALFSEIDAASVATMICS